MEESRSDAEVGKPDEERPRARSQTLVDEEMENQEEEEVIPLAKENPVNSTEKVAVEPKVQTCCVDTVHLAL